MALGDNRWWAEAAVILSRSFGEGLLARVMKDEAKARAAFSKARAEQEKIVQAQPDYGPALCVLGLIDAALGRKEQALEEARRAIELLPVEKDSVNGSRMPGLFRDHRRLGRRERSCLAATGTRSSVLQIHRDA